MADPKQMDLQLEVTVSREYTEPLAMHPAAMAAGFAVAFPVEREEPKIEMHGRVAIVAIRGPLEHHSCAHADSYDAIKSRVAEALGTQATTALLSIDSPGGLVSGAFDCSDELRAMAAAAGKTLVAYVDGTACSAAYALACAASEIVIPPAGEAGSIGVFRVVNTVDKLKAASGITGTVIKSGARKADGNPDEPLTDAGAAEIQRTIDAQASVFFDLVSRARGIPTETIAAMEGRVYCGAEAVSIGLADSVESEDQLVARLNGETTTATVAPQGQEGSAMDLDEMKKALKAAAEGEGEEAARAKRALAALEGEDEHKEPDGDEKAEDGEPDGDEPKKDEEDKAAKALALAESVARAQIMSGRPDLTAEQSKAVAKVSLEQLPGILAAIPRNVAPAEASRLALGVQPTRSSSDDSHVKTEADALVEAALGIVSTPVTQRVGNALAMRACTPDEARRHYAALPKE